MKKRVNKKDRFVVVMAGGRGERFWPVSREKTPKQLISLLGKQSFLQDAVGRVASLVPPENIFVITNRLQVDEVRKQLPKVPDQNVVAEPIGRDTCAAVTLGAALVGARSKDGVMAVLPADHVISEPQTFRQVLSDAFDWAKHGGDIVTIGIQPTEPATGFGYIECGPQLSPPENAGEMSTTFFQGKKFVEKPNYETAVKYLKSGAYRWNAGMFIWSFSTIFQGLQRHQPEMARACERWMKKVDGSQLDRTLAREYPKIQKISIDYALLEKVDRFVVADGSFNWDDLGAWPALAHHLTPDADGNYVMGDVVEIDSQRNIIVDARKNHRAPIAMVGLSDSIIVQTDDATLVASQQEAQKIKELVAKLGADKKYKRLV